MIVLWYRHRGQRPTKANIIKEDAYTAVTLPANFKVAGVEYGRRLSEDEFDANQFALRVEQPSDSIGTTAVEAIATAFEDNWGGSIEFVESVVQS